MKLHDNVVAVTGANGNLGRAVAQAALAQGAKVALLDVSFGADMPASAPGTASVHPVNLLDAQATRACFAAIGRVDVLCNIAGGFAMGDPVHATGDEVWTRMFDLNVRTLLNSVRAAAPGMIERGRGKIVNVGATGGLAGQAGMAAYSAAKSAVIRITESMAAELKRKGINVNCVLPSIIDTPQNRAAMPKADPSHWVAPVDLASVILFLASDEARAVHGAALPVTNLV
jgi:NAD(P)-dependent dehydrogenase (short-subunit alcohol dehydrogenase family)